MNNNKEQLDDRLLEAELRAKGFWGMLQNNKLEYPDIKNMKMETINKAIAEIYNRKLKDEDK